MENFLMFLIFMAGYFIIVLLLVVALRYVGGAKHNEQQCVSHVIKEYDIYNRYKVKEIGFYGLCGYKLKEVDVYIGVATKGSRVSGAIMESWNIKVPSNYELIKSNFTKEEDRNDSRAKA